jgi:hypothetical protein
MTVSFRHWLPKGAFTEDRVRQVLTGLVAAWSAKWFARGRVTVSDVSEGSHDALVSERRFAFEMSLDRKRRLLNALLDVDLLKEKGKDGDDRLLNALAVTVVEDLGERVDALLVHDAEDGGGRVVQVTLAIEGWAIVILLIAEAALVPLIKAGIGSDVPSSQVISWEAALGHTRLVPHAVLGHAELGLNELKELNVGDVVVLDRGLSEPVALCLAGRTIVQGALRRNGNELSIQL